MARPSQAKENLIKAATDLIWESSYGSTSVDDICSRAGVRKGSFYHFFESKAHLAIATIDEAWAQKLPELNAVFSPVIPPLERFERFAEMVLACQEERLQVTGHVCGCPLSALGCEVSTLDELIRAKVAEIFDHHLRFYESAIRDAISGEFICGTDAGLKARTLQTYVQGALTQARVLNDLTPIRQLAPAIFSVLGAHAAVS